MIVERESQATHAKLLAAQEATRNFEKARREHMAIQVRLRPAIATVLCLMQSVVLSCVQLHMLHVDMLSDPGVHIPVGECTAVLSCDTTDTITVAQERLAALDLENKRANFERMSREYEATMARVSGKEGQVDAAQQAANELRAEVNQKVRRSRYKQACKLVQYTVRSTDGSPGARRNTTC